MGSSQLPASHTAKCAATSSFLDSNGSGSAEDSNGLSSLELLDPRVKDLLSELTTETLESISDQVIEWMNKKDGKTLGRVVHLVLERAIDDMTSFEMCVQLCYRMMKGVSEDMEDHQVRDEEGEPVSGGQLFKRFLSLKCQDLFQRIWMQKEVTAVAVTSNNAEDEIVEALSKKEKKKKNARVRMERFSAAQKANQQNLAFVKMISEFFRLEMLTEHILHEQLKKLLGNVKPPTEDVENLRVMFTRVGFLLDTPKARARMDVYFQRIGELTKNRKIKSHLRSILEGVIKLRESNWSVATPMTHETEFSREKKRPPALNLDESPSSPDPHMTTISAIRAIDDLEHISYPEGIFRPKRELNVNAKEGRFRYDRGFLMQFRDICQNEPDKLNNVGLGFLDQGYNVQVMEGGPNYRKVQKQRKCPSLLNLDESPPSPDLHLTAVSAIRAIDDLKRISYPEGIVGPKRELNVNAKEGRFRYDRDFLMQFMGVCQDKPDKLSNVKLGFIDRVQVLEGGRNRPKARN